MDGVVADFDLFVLKNMGRTFDHNLNPGGDKEMWDFLMNVDRLYYQLEPTTYAERLLDAIVAVGAKHRMLTAIPRRASIPTAEIDKVDWMHDKLPKHKIPVVIGPYSRDKWKHIENPGDILIDDREDNIAEWIAKGGIGILHDYNDVEKTLKQLAYYVNGGEFNPPTRTPLFRETKPRKAKYGFVAGIGNNIFEVVQFVNDTLPKQQHTDTWFADIRQGYSNEIAIYINDNDLYDKFRSANLKGK